MAANYWTSTQKKAWSFTPTQLGDIRHGLEQQHAQLVQQHPYPDRRLVFIFLRDRLLQLAKRLHFRQQCVATAMTYMHRFFLSTPMQNVNLYLLAATAFYLASKTEEAPHHIRLVASEARQAWPEFVPGDIARLGEMEFCLISEMRSQLIVWHPYRTLIELKENQDLMLTSDELGLAWCIVNDSYMTDLPLTCPPYLIAIIAMFLAVIFYPNTKAASIRPQQELSMHMDSGLFAGLGGNQGLAGVLGNAVHNLHPGSSLHPASATLSHNSNGSRLSGNEQAKLISPDRDKAVEAIKESEKLQNVIRFLVETDIDLKMMIEGTQHIISLYEIWEQYNEGKFVKEAVARCLNSSAWNS